jgi:uracil-DNA glycosylase family 4
MQIYQSFEPLNDKIVNCYRCPRLVAFREAVPARAAFKDQSYWRRPIPGFGDTDAWLLVTGLAPSAQGGNRTGRIFTGDETGRFLFNALYKEGFANISTSESRQDPLQLTGCYLTAVVKCVPPLNKPTRQEVVNCNCYYLNELYLLKNVSVILALGRLAFDTVVEVARGSGAVVKRPCQFHHGAIVKIAGFPTIMASYHPSPQNTYTGKLTEEMLRNVLQAARNERNHSSENLRENLGPLILGY